jgi:hypothetical protein
MHVRQAAGRPTLKSPRTRRLRTCHRQKQKKNKMKKVIIIYLLIGFMPTSAKSQNMEPYNHNLPFIRIFENEQLPYMESIKILLVEFKSDTISFFEESLKNNPQIIELQIMNPPQKAINVISENNNKNLTYLFIHTFKDTSLMIPKLPLIKFLSLESQTLEYLSMKGSNLDSLDLLVIKSPLLKEWKTDSILYSLGLIDLIAKKLSNFPIQAMPSIRQFSFDCSFTEIPGYLCNSKDLTHISFHNYKSITINNCFKAKLENCVYSNLTLFDKIDGTVVLEILSKDRVKKE